MRPATLAAPPPAPGVVVPVPRSDWATLAKLLPYVWQWRWRVLVALSFLVGAKVANIGVPLVMSLLSAKFDGWFAAITFSALVVYIAFTVTVTEWRTHFRRAMNEQDSKANTRAVDALINYETVKYFSNEHFEQSRYDDNLKR